MSRSIKMDDLAKLTDMKLRKAIVKYRRARAELLDAQLAEMMDMPAGDEKDAFQLANLHGGLLSNEDTEQWYVENPPPHEQIIVGYDHNTDKPIFSYGWRS